VNVWVWGACRGTCDRGYAALCRLSLHPKLFIGLGHVLARGSALERFSSLLEIEDTSFLLRFGLRLYATKFFVRLKDGSQRKGPIQFGTGCDRKRRRRDLARGAGRGTSTLGRGYVDVDNAFGRRGRGTGRDQARGAGRGTGNPARGDVVAGGRRGRGRGRDQRRGSCRRVAMKQPITSRF
jgi:hypothetical protein